MMDYENYIELLQASKTKLANLKYLLIYEKENILNYVEGINLEILSDEYEKEINNINEVLEIVLKKVNANRGAIYELINGQYSEKARKK